MGRDALSRLNSSLHHTYVNPRNEAWSSSSSDRITSEVLPVGELRQGIGRSSLLNAYFPRVGAD